MIYEILKEGKQNAISTEYLKDILGFNSARELQEQIQRERQAGKVILSASTSPGGYYLPANAAEVREFIVTLESRAGATLDALNSAKQYLQEYEKMEEDASP